MSETRVCTGQCGRTLTVNAENFYSQDGGDGFSRRCRECLKAVARERKAAAREHRKVNPPLKRCAGPCGRELPSDAAHYARDTLDRPRPRCRECELAAELAAAVVPRKRCSGRCGRELPADAEHFHRHGTGKGGLRARCRECVAADRRERSTGRPAELVPSPQRPTRPPPPAPPTPPPAALIAASEALDELLADLPSVPRDPSAAERSRRSMQAADAAVKELERPPFDANEILLTMAEDAEDVDALGAALRNTGWRPESVG